MYILITLKKLADEIKRVVFNKNYTNMKGWDLFLTFFRFNMWIGACFKRVKHKTISITSFIQLFTRLILLKGGKSLKELLKLG